MHCTESARVKRGQLDELREAWQTPAALRCVNMRLADSQQMQAVLVILRSQQSIMTFCTIDQAGTVVHCGGAAVVCEHCWKLLYAM